MSAAYEDLVAVYRDELERQAPMPVWLADQVTAAGTDTRRFFRSSGGPVVDATVDQTARLMAAASRCTPCEHLRESSGPLPTIVALPLDRILCPACHADTAPPDTARGCELCGAGDVDNLAPFVIHVAHAAIIGTVGNCCRWVVSAT